MVFTRTHLHILSFVFCDHKPKLNSEVVFHLCNGHHNGSKSALELDLVFVFYATKYFVLPVVLFAQLDCFGALIHWGMIFGKT